MTDQEIAALPAVIRVADVAAVLDISTDTVYALVRDDKIPALRLGRALRFNRDRIIAFIEGA